MLLHMTRNRQTSSAPLSSTASPAPSRKLLWAGVLFALVYPPAITWLYFVLASDYSQGLQQSLFLIVKSIQFVFPVAWVWFVLREPLRTGRLTARGIAIGALSGALIVGAGWLLFDVVLRDLPIFTKASEFTLQKIASYGIDSVWKFAALAAFYSVIHSFLEEYYWRWFVFGQLRRLVPLWPAIVVSSLGFMVHHVIVLNQIFKDAPALAWLLSAAVALGSGFWAWLYDRTGSLLGPWLSHLLIDAGIFWIGYDLIRGSIAH